MLYGAGVPDKKTMANAPHVGIATVWWEGNPCKRVDSFFFNFFFKVQIPTNVFSLAHIVSTPYMKLKME